MRYGLIGYSLGHTLSPMIHEKIFEELNINATYDVIEIPPEKLFDQIVKSNLRFDYNGLYVTIPHKINVMEAIATINPVAQAIGAINTIKFCGSAVRGYNTDYAGFAKMLEHNAIKVENKVVAVLGSGGASRAVFHYLQQNGAKEIILVTRNSGEVAPYIKVLCYPVPLRILNYNQLQELKVDILINTTPVGMYPNIETSPVEEDVVKKFAAIVDLIYNPAETMLLKHAREGNKKYCNGLYMLVAQAVAAHEIWQDAVYDNEFMNKIFEKVAGEISAG